MKLRRLLLLPFAFAGVPLLAAALAAALAPGPEGRAWAFLAAGVVVNALAAAACARAAAAFEPGDLLFGAWALQAGGYAMLAFSAAVSGPDLGQPYAAFQVVLSVGFNGLAVASLLRFGATYWRAGLDDDGDRGVRLAVWAGAALVTIAFAGLVLVRDAGLFAGQGGYRTLAWLISDATDLATFLLAAPILLVALRMRGGLLQWIWGFITAGNLLWILVDTVAGPLGDWLGQPVLGQLLERAGIAAACGAWAAAAAAQRRIASDLGPAGK